MATRNLIRNPVQVLLDLARDKNRSASSTFFVLSSLQLKPNDYRNLWSAALHTADRRLLACLWRCIGHGVVSFESLLTAMRLLPVTYRTIDSALVELLNLHRRSPRGGGILYRGMTEHRQGHCCALRRALRRLRLLEKSIEKESDIYVL